uniref:Uncharacterized protein n=1 Tax=Sciurus vulgaris TaxID=55149 RepID=A0A8D2ARE8_SCIVU
VAWWKAWGSVPLISLNALLLE